MGRLIKFLAYLVALGAVGLVGYALLSPLPAPTEKVVVPVTPQAQ